jgi:hypothetical protein
MKKGIPAKPFGVKLMLMSMNGTTNTSVLTAIKTANTFPF